MISASASGGRAWEPSEARCLFGIRAIVGGCPESRRTLTSGQAYDGREFLMRESLSYTWDFGLDLTTWLHLLGLILR